MSSEFLIDYGPGVDSASNRNEYQEYFLVGKGGRCVGLTTLPPSCADCLEIWEPQPPEALRASPGLWWDCFNFTLFNIRFLNFSGLWRGKIIISWGVWACGLIAACRSEFYIYGSVHRESNLITVQQVATYSVYYISVGSSTCFGCWHPSSGARTAVITAPGTGQPGLLPFARLEFQLNSDSGWQ